MQTANVTSSTNSYYIYSAGRVNGGVSVNLESGLNSADPCRRDRVLLLFRMYEKRRLIGAPPHVLLANHGNVSVAHDMWTADLRRFADPEQTAAWHSLCARIHSAAPLPADLRGELLQVLLTNAKNAARLAVFMGHRRLFMLVNIYATVDVPYVAGTAHAGGGRGAAPWEPPPPRRLGDVIQTLVPAPVPAPAPAPARGLTQEEIDRCLTLFACNSQVPQNCAVCLEDIAVGSMAGWLSCAHSFHPGCISRWLGINPSCPLCRTAIN